MHFARFRILFALAFSALQENFWGQRHIQNPIKHPRWSFLRKQLTSEVQTQPSRGVLKKRCSENMQQIYRRIPMPKCNFNKVAKESHFEITLRHGCSPVDFLHILRTLFLKNTPEGLLLEVVLLKLDCQIFCLDLHQKYKYYSHVQSYKHHCVHLTKINH